MKPYCMVSKLQVKYAKLCFRGSVILHGEDPLPP